MPKKKTEQAEAARPRKQVFYTSQAREFVDALPADAHDEVIARFHTLEKQGFLEFPAGRKLDRGLFEVRVATDGNAYRVFYCYDTGTAVWALSGFVKKTQQTPLREIARALKIKRSIGL